MDLSNEDRPLIEFPCAFPLKVMGHNTDDFAGFVFTLLQPYIPDLTPEALTTRLSNGGHYLAVTVTFIAHSQDQLDDIYRELSAHKRVLMAL